MQHHRLSQTLKGNTEQISTKCYI